MDLDALLNPGTLAMLIPVLVILGGIVVGIGNMIMHHRERMAMIERGMDPNAHKRIDKGCAT
jgi:hypothetical protein